MFKNIIHLLLINLLLLGSIVICSDEAQAGKDTMHHMEHQEDHSCCPTQHPNTNRYQPTAIVQSSEIVQQKILPILLSFNKGIGMYYFPENERINIEIRRDRQHFFFTDTIRLLI